MGYRLSKIYTRGGDRGSTGVAGGRRLPKQHLLIECLGEIDELNSHLGVLRSLIAPGDHPDDYLEQVQNRLFDIGGHLSMPEYLTLTEDHVSELERWLDGLNQNLPPLKEFILPGGNPAASQCHLARTVCRRAERRLWQLHGEDNPEKINPLIIRYVNRLSDLLFVIGRYLNVKNGHREVLWRNPRKSTG